MRKLLLLVASVLALLAIGVVAAAAAPLACGVTCPAGDVKWEEGSGYEYTDGSATIEGDANSVTITITDGYVFVSGCIKIGGPGGGSLITISGPGTYGPYAYGISHVVVSTDPEPPTDTPVPSDTPTPTAIPTDTATPTDTETPTNTPTGTIMPSNTPTVTGTATATPPRQPTNTPRPKTGGGGPSGSDALTMVGVASLVGAASLTILLAAFFAAVKKGRLRL